MRALLAAVLVTVAGTACAITPIDYERLPPADWPRLTRITIFAANQPEIDMRCWSYGLRWNKATEMIRGCAYVDFCARTCTKVYAHWSARSTKEHEEAHCQGFDHVGERPTLADAWASHKAKGARACISSQ